MTEQYCPRWGLYDWGRDEQVERCAECGARVHFNPERAGERPRLVCVDCLLALSRADIPPPA